MSHFSIFVIGENIEGQLEPYSENLDVEAYEDGTAQDTLDSLEQGLKYYQNDATPKKFLGKTVETLTLEEKLELLEGWSGGEYRQDENGDLIRYTTYNPDSRWDWYEIGGRWSGYFPVKKGTPQDAFEPSRVHWSEKFQGENSVEADVVGTVKAPDLTDSALKKYIDFGLMRKAAEIKALKLWEDFEEATKGTTSPGSWRDFARKIVGPAWDLDSTSDMSELEREGFNARVEKARNEFGKEPFVIASRKLNIWGDAHTYFMLDAPDPKAAFIQRSINTSTTAFAILKDGEWIEKGKMGWFGFSTDKFDEDEWDTKVNEFLDSLPDDTLITVVDCHI
jgi:hypothetical protein